MIGLKEISLPLSEKEYRDLELLSYSFLSTLDREGIRKAMKEVIPTDAMIFGTLVDSMIDDSINVDNYCIVDEIKLGDKLKKAVDVLFIYLKSGDNDIVPKLKYYRDDLIELCDNNSIDYYTTRKGEWVADKILDDKAASLYFEQLTICMDKLRVTSEVYYRAEKAEAVLKTHKFTHEIFKNKPGQDSMYQYKNKVRLLGYEFKGMLDRLIVDHKNKIIYPYDLKTGSKDPIEFEASFFFWRYDLQAFIYTAIVKNLRDKYFPGYKISDFKFVYISRYSLKPLVWKVKATHMKGALEGFTRDGKKYKGLREILKDYEWYKSNGFNVEYPESIYKNNGEVIINDNNIKINEPRQN